MSFTFFSHDMDFFILPRRWETLTKAGVALDFPDQGGAGWPGGVYHSRDVEQRLYYKEVEVSATTLNEFVQEPGPSSVVTLAKKKHK